MTEQEWRDMVDQDEAYLVKAIRVHLLEPAQRQWLFDHDITIEDMLNGRIEGGAPPEVIGIFQSWNDQLGWREFNA